MQRGSLSWQAVLAKSSVRSLVGALEVKPASGFDGYVQVARQVFLALFGNLGLGFLIVHERPGGGASECEVEVVEVVEPSRHTEGAA